MNLSDREILELNELCGAVVDGTLTDAQRARLAMMLRESEAARRHYVRAMGQSASLHAYAAEMQVDAPDRPRARTISFRALGWLAGSFAAAAGFALAVWSARAPASRENAPAAPKPAQAVARITGEKNTRWAHSTGSGRAGGGAVATRGSALRRGQRIELESGYAEITFDSGARVVLEGAASLEINSAWDATLRHGTLKASVPPEAIGFRISSTAVDVTDLGTEFTMIADGAGAAEVLVLKGEVEVAPRNAPDVETILLRENESRRFEKAGMTEVADSGEKFARFTQHLTLDRISPTIRYGHWSFDETTGDVAEAEIVGGMIAADQARLAIIHADGGATRRTAGRHGTALSFDGQTEARGAFRGISSERPHTIAFWVKVPEDAQLSDAYSMVAWAMRLPKVGGRPVQISWNRRPAEGAVGALRTDFGGGYAMGTTSLRDGRWHHLVVCFEAGSERDVPVQVTQYVDGRLESSTITQTKMSSQPGHGDAAVPDVVWLGARLTGQQRRERFRGEIDEFFIADRTLEPNEIVALMRDNRPPNTSLAATP
jgi:ferric-dicitrate binding protein FerR (iron transport regulator)